MTYVRPSFRHLALREGETATFLSRWLVFLNLRGGGFAPRQLGPLAKIQILAYLDTCWHNSFVESTLKPLEFLGSSQDDLRDFPASVRHALGLELMRVQFGFMPTDFKPMPVVGSGAYEVRVQIKGAWRAIYVAKFEAKVYVLHAFQKKTPKTRKEDIELASKRYKQIGA